MIEAAPALVPPPAPQVTPVPRGLLFRFVCAYLAFYHLAFTNDFPGSEWLSERIRAGEYVVVRWFGGLLGITAANASNGSGDTTFNYLELLLFVGLAAIAAAVWRWRADPRRDERLCAAARWFLRYVAAFFMLTYGFSKLVPLQMPAPGPYRLIERVGDMSPMGMLWTFIGSSTAYEMFAGAGETLGGLLLLFRRTTTLGALVSCGVMTNVVLLNFCYDVPVKLFSLHLLATLAFLLAPDARRVAGALLGRAVPAAPAAPRPTWRRRVVELLVVAYLLGWGILKDLPEAWTTYGGGAPRLPVHGVWDVEALVRDGVDVPRWGSADAWRRFIVDRGLGIQALDDRSSRFGYTYQADKQVLVVQPSGALTVAFPDADHMTVAGVLGKNLVELRLARVDESKFLLRSRGFHWINEFPFNR